MTWYLKVNEKTIDDNPRDPLISRLADEFRRGIDLLDRLTDELYAGSADGTGSIGAHFRHNLDFAANLVRGLESGRIDYNERERDRRVETDRRYARERFMFLAGALRNAAGADPERELLVRSELDGDLWHRSTPGRELEFLHSHTVHHYALIAERLRAHGFPVPDDFGVAPSTLEFWDERNRRTRAA